MPAPTLQNMESQLDQISDDRFFFAIGAIPNIADTTDLSFGIDSVTLPANRISTIEWKLFGHTRKYRGAQTPGDGRVQLIINENVTMAIYKKLHTWNAAGVDPETGNSDPAYQTTADLFIYDTTGAQAIDVTFYNLWCEDIQATTLSGQSSKGMQITATLCFDWFDYDDNYMLNALNGGIGSGLALSTNGNLLTASASGTINNTLTVST